MTPRLSLLLALDTNGRLYFSLNHVNTDSDVIKLFFFNFAEVLDAEDPEWRSNTVLLLDNAPYHTSKETRTTLH